MCKKILCFLTIISFLLLNACAMYQKDGPPSYPVDVSNIPNAVPKMEPRSRFGNYSSYRVRGKTYHVMRSSKHYVATGIASWYGTRFHQQRTSNGERYDMLAMTAAHKTLPLPTYVQVTNLRNGKKIIVRVNDRGPFEENRLIDLSYVAAKKLGMLGKGTTRVRIVAIDPTQYGKYKRAPLYTRSSVHHRVKSTTIYLQVGAFQNQDYAEQLKKQLALATSSPVQVTPYIQAGKRLFKVQVGPIRDTVTADTISKKLQTMGIEARKI